MSSATHKHRAAFTLALRTISPSLSALHASRLRLIPTEERERTLGPDRPQAPLTALTCVHCGHASVHVRVIRLGMGNGNGNGKQKTRKITDRNKDQDKGKQRENSKVTDEYNVRKETPPRAVERTCTMCAFVEYIPMPRGAAALFESNSSSSVRKARRVARLRSGETEMLRGDDAGGSAASSLVLSNSPGTTTQPVAAPAGAQPLARTPRAHAPPVQSLPPAPDLPFRKRLKKKPGLHELLERNRQRQDAAARSKAPGGLSSFLDGL